MVTFPWVLAVIMIAPFCLMAGVIHVVCEWDSDGIGGGSRRKYKCDKRKVAR